ncbi:hypothetical protein IGI04_037426, partial [Brassica rapa subsp. trilocularis]
MKYVVLLRKNILLGIQNRLPTIKRFPPRDQVMKQQVQIHHLPAMNSTTHRNVSLLLHSTTHCNVSLLCFWEARNSKKGEKFMGIDIVLVDEKPENHGKLKLGSYEAYDRETKAGACLRITKHSDFEYCPTPMEHGYDISGGVSSSPKSESKTLVVRLSLTSVNANFVCQIHGFIEK